MRVEVASPEIRGETVTFRWTQSEPNPYQFKNSFFLRYEGIDLSRFSRDLFHELFLSLQLRVFADYGTPIDLVFSHPVPAPMIAFWSAYHNADLVTVSPVAPVRSYLPWAIGATPPANPQRVGVFFGGGKDSMATSCLLTEIKGPDNVVLFQMIHPMIRGRDEMERIAERQDNLMLQPVRDVLGVSTQRVRTNYMAQLRLREKGGHVRPHLELYSAGFLPATLALGISTCSPALERTAYRIMWQPDGSAVYRYQQSRLEMLQAQSRYYQAVLGVDLAVTNFNIMFGSLMAVRLLAERYPNALQEVVMCNLAPPGARWCYHCTKCVEYVFYGLRCGIVDDRFDYDFFFTQSQYVKQLMDYAESGVELSNHGNAPWTPFISIAGHYAGLCHSIAYIHPALLQGRIGAVAAVNLGMIRALFGNTVFPNVEMIDNGSVEKIGLDLARAMAKIAGEHFTTVDNLPHPIVIGNDNGAFDYGHHMPLRRGMVEFGLSEDAGILK